MPHSATDNRPGKRDRLVASARELLHQRGVERPTLAEIAHAADVPPGNVYYYFKTRDDLIRAVVGSTAEDVRALLAAVGGGSRPQTRLKRLTRAWADVAELVAAHGCPVGSLASGLRRHEDGLGEEAAGLFRLILDWADEQFREMGRRDARELATTLLAGVQGASVLAHALEDPKLLSREVRRLERWIDSLA
jgi:AcrR family transcriptional regulator